MAVDDFDVTLRKLTVRDERFVATVLGSEEASLAESGLDRKTHALVQISALIALDAAPQSYASCVDAARCAGASREEIVGTLVALISVVGTPRVVSAAPKLGLALGYDLDAALEADLETTT
jgi:4-carboxymuconolactone decarboxylase